MENKQNQKNGSIKPKAGYYKESINRLRETI